MSTNISAALISYSVVFFTIFLGYRKFHLLRFYSLQGALKSACFLSVFTDSRASQVITTMYRWSRVGDEQSVSVVF